MAFGTTLIGQILENFMRDVEFENSIGSIHTYIFPSLIGVIAGLFGYYYWKKKNQHIESSSALVESEEKFRTFFYKNGSVCLLIEADTGKIIDANDAALEFYGYSYSEITSLNISKINTLPEEKIKLKIKNTIESGQKYYNFQHRVKSGEVRHVEVYSASITIDRKIFLFSIIHDVSDRIRTEQINKILKHSLDVYTDGIYWMDSDNRFIYVNEAGGKAFGCKPEELLGKSLSDVNPTTTPESLTDLWNKLRTQGFYTAETVHRRFDGTEFYVEIRTVYFVFEGKEYNSGYARDITERKLVEKELIQAKEKAEESDRLKSAFLQNMSHEIRTPLNAIVGLSGLITKKEKTPEQLEKYSEIISKSSDKLLRIITDIIEISQIQAKQITLKITEFNILNLISQLEREFIGLANEKNINLRFDVEFHFQKINIQSDFEKLKRILSHLIDNAIKFTTRGSVSFKFEIIGEKMLFTIEDTGIGIPDEIQNQIFEPFRQVETGIIRNYGGNGLGLSIAGSFTQILKGNISMKSEIDKGTVFILSFPVQLLSENQVKESRDTKNIKLKTILIAEDEYSNFVYLSELLEFSGIEILYAENGKQAVDLCKTNNSIGLIFMDIKMPVMDGYTAAKLIREFRPDLTIIAQTAYALQSEIDQFIAAFDDYITKPINKNQLADKLRLFATNQIAI